MNPSATPAAAPQNGTEAEAILKEQELSPKEAAAELQCCTKTVLTLVSLKKIAPVFRYGKRGPGAIGIPRSAIENYKLMRRKAALEAGKK